MLGNLWPEFERGLREAIEVMCDIEAMYDPKAECINAYCGWTGKSSDRDRGYCPLCGGECVLQEGGEA